MAFEKENIELINLFLSHPNVDLNTVFILIKMLIRFN